MLTETRRDPATGEQYTTDTIITNLRLRPPFTGFCYDQLRRKIRTAPPHHEPYLDNVLTRLEAATRPATQATPHPHSTNTVTIPLLSHNEITAVKTAFTTDPRTPIHPVTQCITSQLPPQPVETNE